MKLMSQTGSLDKNKVVDIVFILPSETIAKFKDLQPVFKRLLDVLTHAMVYSLHVLKVLQDSFCLFRMLALES